MKVEKKTGESLSDTSLINGIVLDKEIVQSGMPKRVEKAKIALIDASLEIEKPELDSKINIESPDMIEAFLKARRNNAKRHDKQNFSVRSKRSSMPKRHR